MKASLLANYFKKSLLKALTRHNDFFFPLLTILSVFCSIFGYTVKDAFPENSCFENIVLMFAVFLVLKVLYYRASISFDGEPYKININGVPVVIKRGDIFKENGWKVIPFNDRYDTKVDDKIISHNSLNGQLIDEHIDDLEDLENTIKNYKKDNSPLHHSNLDGGLACPLGSVICYKDFLLLAFSHFDVHNQAYLDIGEYEGLLFNMWKELRIIYAGRPLAIPLLGTGITTFKVSSKKDHTEILRCILWTLRRSGFQPQSGLNIVLTKETIENIDMYRLREEFYDDVRDFI